MATPVGAGDPGALWAVGMIIQPRFRLLSLDMSHSFHRTITAMTLVFLASCTTESSGGAFNYECPAEGLEQVSLVDVSASGRVDTILTERLNAVQVDAEMAADCDGSLVVVAWAGSSSSSKILFTGDIPISGATEIGKDRKIPEAVDKVMGEVRDAMNAALVELSPEQSDLSAGFALISDLTANARAQGLSTVAHVYTDAISTGGNARVNDPGITDESVDSLIGGLSLPDLNGVVVKLYGVGRVAGVPSPPQDYIDVIHRYASGMCEKTGADCSVFTTVVSS